MTPNPSEPQRPAPGVIVGLDPGTRQSARALYVPATRTVETAFLDNEELLIWLGAQDTHPGWLLAVEEPSGFIQRAQHRESGSIGKDILRTAMWTGRFVQAFPGRHTLLTGACWRSRLVGAASARGTEIRRALIDHFGGEAEAIGGKRCPQCGGAGKRLGREPCRECEQTGLVMGRRGAKKCPACHGAKTRQAYAACPCGDGWLAPPGPLAGIVGEHCWDAAGIAVVAETMERRPVTVETTNR